MNIMYYLTVILLIHVIDNDIERNPGPNDYHSRDMHICHLNMQSMKRNKEKIKHLDLQLGSKFDIITNDHGI